MTTNRKGPSSVFKRLESVPYFVTYLKPVLPRLAQDAEAFFQLPLTWDALSQDLAGHEIAPFKAMMQRVELDKVNAMVADSKDNLQVTADAPKTAAPEKTAKSFIG